LDEALVRLRATRSSSQALAAGKAPLVTGLCARGRHDECSGKVYDGHNVRRHGRKVAGYVKCGCDCHGEAMA